MTSIDQVEDGDEKEEVSLMAKVDHELTNLPSVKSGSQNKVMPAFVSEPQLDISKNRDNWIEFKLKVADLKDSETYLKFSDNFNPNGYFSKDNQYKLIRPAKVPPPGEMYDTNGNLVEIVEPVEGSH